MPTSPLRLPPNPPADSALSQIIRDLEEMRTFCPQKLKRLATFIAAYKDAPSDSAGKMTDAR